MCKTSKAGGDHDVAAVLPMYAGMPPEELAALAQATLDEIGPALQAFRQDAKIVYPMSAHLATGWVCTAK
jgi:hypothetical protein